MVITVYQMGPSPPCRAVLLTARALGIAVVTKEVDLLHGGTRTPEYLRMNPQHTVPTMDDNGLILGESRAIMEYLSDTYGKSDALFPKNPKKRAVVSSRLYFDAATLTAASNNAYGLPAFRGTEAPPGSQLALEDALDVLNKLIGNNLYVAGDQLTIADITTAVTVSNIADVFGHKIEKFKNLARWFKNVKKNIPGYAEINEKQIEVVKQYLKSKAQSTN